MAVTTKSNLITRAEEVRVEQDINDNSALRVGQLLRDMVETILTGQNIAAELFAEPDINALTDALLDKLTNIETGATADQTAAEIRDLLQTLTGTSRLPASAIKDLPTAGISEVDATQGMALHDQPKGTTVRLKGVTDLTLECAAGAADHFVILERYDDATAKFKVNYDGVTSPNVANILNVIQQRDDGQNAFAIIRWLTTTTIVVNTFDMIFEADVSTPDAVLGADSLSTLNVSSQTGWTAAGAPVIGADYITTDGTDDAYFRDVTPAALDKAMVVIIDMQSVVGSRFRFGFCDTTKENNSCMFDLEGGDGEIYIRNSSNGVTGATPFDDDPVPLGYSSGLAMIYLELNGATGCVLEAARLNDASRNAVLYTHTRIMNAGDGAYTGCPRLAVGAEYRQNQTTIFRPGEYREVRYTNKLSAQKRADLWQAYKNLYSV